MEFRASWFSENSDRGIAISVSILSSGFSDALFVCFWWLVTLERLLAICIRTFLILQVLNLKPPTWTSRIRIFWLWSEFSDCDQNFLIVIRLWSEFSDCDQNFLIVIRIFWLWSEFSDCDQNFWLWSEFLIVIKIFWLIRFSDHNFWLWSNWGKNAYWVNFLITIRIFWLWSEFSDCDQIEKKTHAYWEINKTERPKTTIKDLKRFFASTDPPSHKPWHTFWHFIICNFFWCRFGRSIWHQIWRSIWQIFCKFYLAKVLAFCLAYILIRLVKS